jgi:hypothetical protein
MFLKRLLASCANAWPDHKAVVAKKIEIITMIFFISSLLCSGLGRPFSDMEKDNPVWPGGLRNIQRRRW